MELSKATVNHHHQEEEEEEERDNSINNLPIISIATSDDHDQSSDKDNKGSDEVEPTKRLYRYMECMKNHAASIGGISRDGCGEFIPSSSSNDNNHNHNHHESLYCSVCNCHRNFHRKDHDHHHRHHHHNNLMRPRNFYAYPRPPPPPPPPMIMPCNYHIVASGSHKYAGEREVVDNDNNNNNNKNKNTKKRRFRTKFSQEQREKMVRFAERVGWKIQKEEESVVRSFCQEIGVKRRVLKVWMHNNKNSKLLNTINIPHPPSSS